jgi:uncharacterized membrane-anchored protein YitT (DUF2179 family)
MINYVFIYESSNFVEVEDLLQSRVSGAKISFSVWWVYINFEFFILVFHFVKLTFFFIYQTELKAHNFNVFISFMPDNKPEKFILSLQFWNILYSEYYTIIGDLDFFCLL